MKNLFYFLLLASTLFIACNDDDDDNAPSGLIGEWEWVQSYGGLAGDTLTPASEGFTSHLEIDADTYQQFLNDSLVFQSQYELETRQDSLFGTDKVIAFETGYELAVIQQGDDLKLIEICLDCYEHTYERR